VSPTIAKRYGEREHEESFVELRDAAKVIAEALSRLGRNLYPASDDDLDRVVQYVSDLTADDRAMYDELVSALIRTEDLRPKKRGPVFCEALATRKDEPAKPFVPVRIYAERAPTDEFLTNEAPSQGRLLTALDTVARKRNRE
jgi:hypothetical protein